MLRSAMTTVRLPFSLALCLIGCAILAAGCGGPAPDEGSTGAEGSAAASTPTVYAAYVLLSGGPQSGPAGVEPAEPGLQAQARVILDDGVGPDGAPCPQLTPAGGSGAAAIAMIRRGNPHGFEVAVCQAVIPLGTALTVSWGDGDGGETLPTLPAVATDPGRIAFFGDTGCKEKNCPSDDPSEHFAVLAQAAAALDPPPDLVLHAGDYNYRGTGYFQQGDDPVYDAGDTADTDPECQLDAAYVSQNSGYGNSQGLADTWQNWWLDFFEPGAPLFATAPMIVTRGNHELCSRAGPGFFYFLDTSLPPQLGGGGELACPDQGGQTPPTGAADHIILRDPYSVDLGSLRVLVLDSANACDNFAPTATSDILANHLVQLLDQADDNDQAVWHLTHRPFWGIDGQDGDGNWTEVSQGLEAALAKARAQQPSGTFQLALAGHMHQFLSVTPQSTGQEQVPQLIVGNSGVDLSNSDPEGAFTATIENQTLAALAYKKHGFLDIQSVAADGSWKAALVHLHKDGSQEILATCSSDNLPGSVCEAAGDG